MPRAPRSLKPFKTQRRTMEKIIDDIKWVVFELGTDSDGAET